MSLNRFHVQISPEATTFTRLVPQPTAQDPHAKKIIGQPWSVPVAARKIPDDSKDNFLPQSTHNLFHTEAINAALESVNKQPLRSPLWNDSIDIRKIKYATLRDHPQEGREVLDMIFQSYRQFSPIRDVFRKIESNPNITPPEAIKIAFNSDDESVILNAALYFPEHLKAIEDDIEKRRIKQWLDSANFVDVYQHLFDVDLNDVIKHEKSWAVYRWMGLILGVAEWGLGLIPFGAAGAALYTTGNTNTLSTFLQDPVGNPATAALIMLLGISAVNSPTGMKDSPLLVFIKAMNAVGQLTKFTQRYKLGKFSGLFETIGDFFKRDQTNYFLAKHLDPIGLIKKYIAVALKHGPTGVEMESFKDFPNEYKGYKFTKKLFSLAESSLNNTGIKTLQSIAKFLPATIKYLPSTNGQLVGSVVQNTFVMGGALALGLATGGGTPDWSQVGSLALSTGMLIVASSAAKARVDHIKKENPAEALVYRQLIDFSVVGLSVLSNNVPYFQNPLAFSGALAASIIAILGVGQAVRVREKQIFFADEV